MTNENHISNESAINCLRMFKLHFFRQSMSGIENRDEMNINLKVILSSFNTIASDKIPPSKQFRKPSIEFNPHTWPLVYSSHFIKLFRYLKVLNTQSCTMGWPIRINLAFKNTCGCSTVFQDRRHIKNFLRFNMKIRIKFQIFHWNFTTWNIRYSVLIFHLIINVFFINVSHRYEETCIFNMY